MIALILVLVVLLIVVTIAGWALSLVISAAIVGAIIGGLARLVLPGRQDIGVFTTIVLGWIGSVVGSFVGRHVFHVGTFLTILVEIGLAAVLVAVGAGGAASLNQGGSRR